MYFAESARIAERHPDLAATIQKVDAQLARVSPGAVIYGDDWASLLRADRHQVGSVLELLADAGILQSQEMFECEHCEMPVLRSDYEAALEEEDEYRCTSCDRPWEEGPGEAITTFGLGEKWKEIPEARMMPRPPDATGATVLRGRSAEEEAPSPYCRVITRSGTSTMPKSRYDELVRRRDQYGMFIDALTGEASCRQGNGRPRVAKLTPSEAGILVDLVEAGKPMRPRATQTGDRCASADAASRLLERARRKADVKLGRYEFRAFRLHKSPDPKFKSYAFAPPDDLEYCVIAPA